MIGHDRKLVYILQCSDGTFYVGSSQRPVSRIAAHELGEGSDYTRRRQPVELVFATSFSNYRAAVAAERQFKGWSRRKKQALIDGRFDLLVEYSKSCVVQHGEEDASTSSA
jgi:putative endonuclease